MAIRINRELMGMCEKDDVTVIEGMEGRGNSTDGIVPLVAAVDLIS